MDFRHGILQAPEFFVGRHRELEEIERFLYIQHYHREGVLKIIGPAGSGKTTLARYAASRQRHLSPIWVSFDNSGRQLDEFRRQYFKQTLSSNGERPHVLIVLDGVEDTSEEFLSEWMSAIFNYKRVGGVILTSRLSIPVQGHQINCGAMTFDDAREFLHHRLSRQLTRENEEAFISKSGGFPSTLSAIAELLKDHRVERILSGLDGGVYSLEKAEESKIIQAVRPQIVSFSESLAVELKKTPEKIHGVTSRQFEHLIAELFDDMGWEVELTKATRDGGRDILARMNTGSFNIFCLIEAKKYRKDRSIGVQLVRNLYGTFCDEKANSAMLVTTSRFTDDAVKFRERHKYQLELKDYTDVIGWLAGYKKPR